MHEPHSTFRSLATLQVEYRNIISTKVMTCTVDIAGGGTGLQT